MTFALMMEGRVEIVDIDVLHDPLYAQGGRCSPGQCLCQRGSAYLER